MSACAPVSRAFLLLLLALVLGFAVGVAGGCRNIGPEPCLHCPGPPPPVPPITPLNAMLRFESTYENRVLPEYRKLFTSNFRFAFSRESDSTLVDRYGDTWGKDDEIESTRHLFDGFTPSEPPYEFRQPAQVIALSLDGVTVVDDPSRPDSAAFYKRVLVQSATLSVTIVGGDEFQVSSPHDFHLVRGDAAVLDASQEARTDRWYIHRWVDKAPTPEPGILPTRAVSWGRLKATYR